MLVAFVKLTVTGLQPPLLSFVNFAFALTRAVNCCCIESVLQPKGLVVTNLISTESLGNFKIKPGKAPVELLPIGNEFAYH